MKNILILIFLFITLGSYTQEKSDYGKEFEWIVKTFSENDAGFPQIVDKKGVEDYNSFTNKVREEVSRADSIEAFHACIVKWLKYFRKGHFSYISKGAEWESNFFKKNDSIKNLFQISRLSESTLYLKIPSMGLQYKPVMDSLLKVNEKLLRKTPNLIIDIRDSRGGSDLVYSGLEPYIYTSPVRRPVLEIRCTAFTADIMKKISSNPDLDMDIKKQRESRIELIMQNEGKFSDLGDNKDQTWISIQREVLPFPQKVGIIYCGSNGSADEGFLLYARQSYKVKTYGVNTFGVFDVSNLEMATSPYTGNSLLYATTRIKWLPKFSIDDIGFTPDIFLGDLDPEIWVDEVMRHMESN